jgi:hypothetical protein
VVSNSLLISEIQHMEYFVFISKSNIIRKNTKHIQVHSEYTREASKKEKKKEIKIIKANH